MTKENMENLDSETQENVGDDVTTKEVEETSSETEATVGAEAIAKAQQIAEDQKRRAEKAEQKLKDLKAQLEEKEEVEPKTEGQEAASATSGGLSKEETILYAKGFSEEEIEKIVSIAKIEGESPLVAAESDYFKLWKEKEDKNKETQNTQLGASRGSAHAMPKKTISDPGLSADEHKELWKQQMGR